MRWLGWWLAWVVPLVGWAVPVVGPLDGTAGPSLPAVAQPILGREEELFNPTLAQHLERRGLLAAATLEWARLEADARGAERVHVLEALVRLSYQQGERAAAARLLEELQALKPAYQPSAAFLVAQLAGAQAVAERQALLQALEQRFPTLQESVTARWTEIWRQAHQTGRVPQTWGVPEATLLSQRLGLLQAEARIRWSLAVGLSWLPGLGHALLGAWAQAVALLLGWALLGLAFLSACRHRHYAYALVVAIPFVALWVNAPLSAAAAAEAYAQQARTQAMARWQDLRPTYIPVKAVRDGVAQ